MRLFHLIVCCLCSSPVAYTNAIAQVELVRNHFFPAELEFIELQDIKSEQNIEDAESLLSVNGARLFLDVGFKKYAQRTYAVADSASLSIEVLTLKDSRAAYSLLTLLRKSPMIDGPPGDVFSQSRDYMLFAQRNLWVRLQGHNVNSDLLSRIANSVSNRIGRAEQYSPPLISHFPKLGYDASTLRYFVGPESFEEFSLGIVEGQLAYNPDMEVAQARYSVGSQTGVLSLLSLPTSQATDEYFDGLGNLEPKTKRIYFKKVGPIIGVLEGSFDSATADQILNSLQYTFSIRWIYDKQNSSLIWGVPVVILGTVVQSLAFVAVLGGISIFTGIGLATFRLLLRKHVPGNYLDRPERTEITHLKMQ